MSEIDDIEKAIEAANKALPYMAAQHLINLCRSVRWENKPIITEIKDNNMIKKNTKFRLTSVWNTEELDEYVKTLRSNGFDIEEKDELFFITLNSVDDVMRIVNLLRNPIIFMYYEGTPEIEIYDDYRE